MSSSLYGARGIGSHFFFRCGPPLHVTNGRPASFRLASVGEIYGDSMLFLAKDGGGASTVPHCLHLSYPPAREDALVPS